MPSSIGGFRITGGKMIRHKSDHPTKNCTVDACERPLRAKGMCGTHYNRTNPNRHKKTLTACTYCGTEILKMKGGGGRKYGPVCSDACRNWLVNEFCSLPADHWARWYGKSSEWTPRVAKVETATFQCAYCQECDQSYVVRWSGTPPKFCTDTCQRRSKRRTRRAREHDAPGNYTWAQVIRLHLLSDRRCSYCDEHVAQPEPDHVVPISRSGRNDIGNILSCCQRCNGDKGDMTPTEWAEYRARRGKPPVRTEFSHKDPRFTHLMAGVASGQSHRITTESLRLAA